MLYTRNSQFLNNGASVSLKPNNPRSNPRKKPLWVTTAIDLCRAEVGELSFGVNSLSLSHPGVLVTDDEDGSYVGVCDSPNSGTPDVCDLMVLNTSDVDASVVVETDDFHV